MPVPRERWRLIRREPGYKVSSRGRVRSVPRTLSDGRGHGGQMLRPKEDADGYLMVKVAGRWVHVHVLVLEAFHGPRPPGMEGCHGPGGRQDNRAEVLRWDSHRANDPDKKRAERINGRGVSPPSPVVTPVTGGVLR
jgi:hypothetical protein